MINDRDDDKSPEEIQRDISNIRAQVSSTIDAIQSKLTPGQMMDQALDFFRGKSGGGGSGDTVAVVGQGANEFATNLGRAMRDNPLPVAVIGLGVAWLMMSDRGGRSARVSVDYDRDRDFDRIDRSIGMRGAMGSGSMSAGSTGAGGYAGVSGSRPSAYGGAGEGTTSVSDHAPSGAPMTAGSGSDEPGMLSSAADRLADAGRTVRDKASDLAASARSTAREWTGSARDGARDLAQGTRGYVSSGTSYASDRAGRLADMSREQYERARTGVSHMADEQPLVIAAFGVAIGAALGALLPSTRKEDELLGETRDQLLRTAKETAQPHVDTLKESAMRVADQAKSQLSGVVQDAKQELSQVAQSAKQEFQQAKDTVLTSTGASGAGSTGPATGGSGGSGGSIGSGAASGIGSTGGVRSPAESLEHATASSATGPSGGDAIGDRGRPS